MVKVKVVNATKMKFAFWWIFVLVVLVSVCLVNRVESMENSGVPKIWEKERTNVCESVNVFAEYCGKPEDVADVDAYVRVCNARTIVINSWEKKQSSGLKEQPSLSAYLDAGYFGVMIETSKVLRYLKKSVVPRKSSELCGSALSRYLRLSLQEIVEATPRNDEINDKITFILKAVIKVDCFKEVHEEFIKEVRKEIHAKQEKREDETTTSHVWSIMELATFLQNDDYVERLRTYKQKQIDPNPPQPKHNPLQPKLLISAIREYSKHLFGMDPPPPTIKNEPPTEPTLQLTYIVLYWLGKDSKRLSMPRKKEFDALYLDIKTYMKYWEPVPISDSQVRDIIQCLWILFNWSFKDSSSWSEDQFVRLRACIQIIAVLMRREFPDPGEKQLELKLSLELFIAFGKNLKNAIKPDKVKKTEAFAALKTCEEVFDLNLDEMIGSSSYQRESHVGSGIAKLLRELRDQTEISTEKKNQIEEAVKPYLSKDTVTHR